MKWLKRLFAKTVAPKDTKPENEAQFSERELGQEHPDHHEYPESHPAGQPPKIASEKPKDPSKRKPKKKE